MRNAAIMRCISVLEYLPDCDMRRSGAKEPIKKRLAGNRPAAGRYVLGTPMVPHITAAGQRFFVCMPGGHWPTDHWSKGQARPGWQQVEECTLADDGRCIPRSPDGRRPLRPVSMARPMPHPALHMARGDLLPSASCSDHNVDRDQGDQGQRVDDKQRIQERLEFRHDMLRFWQDRPDSGARKAAGHLIHLERQPAAERCVSHAAGRFRAGTTVPSAASMPRYRQVLRSMTAGLMPALAAGRRALSCRSAMISCEKSARRGCVGRAE